VGISSDGTRLLVTDFINSRVLLWNTLPASSSVAADVAIGQPNKTTGTQASPPTASSLALPFDACFAENGIVVADSANARVLIWNTVPTIDGTPADVVLGQAGFAAAETRPLGPTSMLPVAVAYNDGRLYVSTSEHILVWDGLPTASDTPADHVIGQTDFTQSLANVGGVGPGTLYHPWGMGFGPDGALFVADQGNSRVVLLPPPDPVTP
jgi:hypothetical protein